ncbi:FAD/FMN-containing dehydrogenase [Streptoalloteichus tenebrarius]|uniref:FAD/FMN-containing dehydrogenase n=1 Tax=Streptoalloteichus tenebrarius (strain ATCC 17920 / DSM 40477 / JCM 4838 / CBS 697.72 / NBRC 16177 / NCIMB 11028 / NRRL B-12390 / A12253. 1 / ISP 5477) TaxID=1933 RepID=A0ABT1HUG1_STRSD|nr:FAD-binding and (Fe-S)-binding domain-containing protein [Streptoalloteichus tenebrarius]MCP2259131.1 FAD/FMN-containing dehydrogenase [Streptoalloteichus tenebrarius]BFF04394.1 FAD-binding and (Fe-S)-binding domain-containing protein [Streptoalloteichus tenebrarius]
MRALHTDLAARVRGEVRFDAGTRAAYSTDASNYRQVPIGVVLPATVDDAVAAVEVCREHGVPVLARGGGTSLAGQCCNTAVVLDFSKYCRRVVSVDPERRTAVVEPGIALDELNRQVAEHGLMVGPKPATHVSCTLGGMIGNNSCGSTAQAYGKMADSVLRLEILTYDGLRTWVGPTSEEEYQRTLAEGGRKAELYQGLRALRDRHMAEIRTRYPDIPRRVSGYNLDALLPEHGFNVARAIVGSESTLATVLRAEISLFEVRPERVLVVLGYPTVFAAADAVPAVLPHRPTAIEGLDRQLVELEHTQRIAGEAVDALPPGGGWLMVQFTADDHDTAAERARRFVEDMKRHGEDISVSYMDDPEHEERLWQAREAALGATAFPPTGVPTHEGWEDAAVPPERLGAYLRDFRELLREFGYQDAALYGHFGQGCVHTRIPFDLRTAAGVAAYRRFVERSADLVVSHGGSLSGEHGDGQSRGELLTRMFGERIVGAFGEMKALFDPDNRMNPGKVVHPNPLDGQLREGVDYRPAEPRVRFAYPRDGHRFSHAVGRCVGVGKCRGLDGGVMCPSFRATHEEEHSTRGRARLLFEMLRGEVVAGWRSTEVRDALDLCLACKGCRSDCPVGVDMATYKAEFLSHHYAHRLRPRSHYSMGWLPLWARIAAVAPGVANALTHAPVVERVAKWVAGISEERTLPRFARQPFTSWLRRHTASGSGSRRDARKTVVLWPDTFSNYFHPSVARAAVEVLEDAGLHVVVPRASVCCGLTWISTGQLGVAQRVLRRTLSVLRPALRAGTPVVVLEPSCAAVFRSDLPELLHGDEDAHRLAGQVRTLAEVLTREAPDWRVPVGRRALVQVHCHQHAVLGFDTDRELMRRCGIDATVLDSGCCGLAGNFGFERGHYAVSMACAEHGLLPAVRDADEDTCVLADGFSCRTQVEQADTGHVPSHLAEVLAEGLRRERGRRRTTEQPSASAPPGEVR